MCHLVPDSVYVGGDRVVKQVVNMGGWKGVDDFPRPVTMVSLRDSQSLQGLQGTSSGTVRACFWQSDLVPTAARET